MDLPVLDVSLKWNLTRYNLFVSDFFYSVLLRLIGSNIIRVSTSFYDLSPVVLYIDYSLFVIYLLMTLDGFHFLAIVNTVVLNIHIQIFECVQIFLSPFVILNLLYNLM